MSRYVYSFIHQRLFETFEKDVVLRDCGSVTGDTYKEEFLYLVNLLERGI